MKEAKPCKPCIKTKTKNQIQDGKKKQKGKKEMMVWEEIEEKKIE